MAEEKKYCLQNTVPNKMSSDEEKKEFLQNSVLNKGIYSLLHNHYDPNSREAIANSRKQASLKKLEEAKEEFKRHKKLIDVKSESPPSSNFTGYTRKREKLNNWTSELESYKRLNRNEAYDMLLTIRFSDVLYFFIYWFCLDELIHTTTCPNSNWWKDLFSKILGNKQLACPLEKVLSQYLLRNFYYCSEGKLDKCYEGLLEGSYYRAKESHSDRLKYIEEVVLGEENHHAAAESAAYAKVNSKWKKESKIPFFAHITSICGNTSISSAFDEIFLLILGLIKLDLK